MSFTFVRLVAAVSLALCLPTRRVLAQTTSDLIAAKEALVSAQAVEVEQLYASRCSSDCASDDECTTLTCFASASFANERQCATQFAKPHECDQCLPGGTAGRRFNLQRSSVRMSAEVRSSEAPRTTPTAGSDADTLQREARDAICFSEGLEPSWIAQQQADSSTAFQFFGSTTGVMRMYPGDSTDRSNPKCDAYDPRVRSWYVSAVSGPKDLIIIVDTSGSMSQPIVLGTSTRLELAKTAVKSVLKTLSHVDRAQVVTFSSAASSFYPPDHGVSSTQYWGTEQTYGSRTTPTLVAMSEENYHAAERFVDSWIPTGTTQAHLGFKKAFDIFAASDSAEMTTGCAKTILFLTDGQFADPDGASMGSNRLSLLNAAHNTHIFTYSVGAGAGHTLPKQIACAHNGVWAGLGDDLSVVRVMTECALHA